MIIVRVIIRAVQFEPNCLELFQTTNAIRPNRTELSSSLGKLNWTILKVHWTGKNQFELNCSLNCSELLWTVSYYIELFLRGLFFVDFFFLLSKEIPHCFSLASLFTLTCVWISKDFLYDWFFKLPWTKY